MRRRISVEVLAYDDYPAEVYREWLKTNSVGHYTLQNSAVFIVDGRWIRVLGLPLKNRDFPDGRAQSLAPGSWANPRRTETLIARSKGRWYLLRTHPEDHLPAYEESQRELLRQAQALALGAVMGDKS